MNISTINSFNIDSYQGIALPLFKDYKEVKYLNLTSEDLGERFEGKKGSVYTSLITDSKSQDITLLGLGDTIPGFRELLNCFTDLFRTFYKLKSDKVLLDLSSLVVSEDIVRAAVEAAYYACYTFDKYKSDKRENKIFDLDILINDQTDFSAVINEAKILSKANLIAREMVNEPSNIMTPSLLSTRAEELASEVSLEVEILGLKEIEELDMKAFLAVAKASAEEAKFIILRYRGDSTSDETIGFVGKGLTYDSGGLSIKPTNSMAEMKSDMAGSAAVFSAMWAIGKLGIKKNVTAVVAACENMISGNSFKPGDIIGSMGGKSIYIGNTDAEGRLTLADAVHYITTREKVNKVVDIATLTGAAIQCTGDIAAPVITNCDEFYDKLNSAFIKSGELIWRMPIFPEYKELLKHDEADITNSAGSPGTITAGLFIGEFVNDLPWIHIDIAGPSVSKKDKGFLTKGGTGFGVKPLYYLVK